jgi:hypothetical protein
MHDDPQRYDHGHAHHLDAHRPHEEAVVLELGRELGALVVYTDALLLHTEIEISPDEDDDQRSHRDVLERVVADRSLYAAVFDKVPAGGYTLWHDGIARVRGATVAGGAVTELDWRTSER